MKKLTFTLLLLLVSICLNAQFVENSPWVKELREKKNIKGDINLYELKSNFDNYWKTNNKMKRGSGANPFMRWFTHWEKSSDINGNIQDAQSFWQAWEQKEQIKLSQKNNQNTVISNWQPYGPFTHTNTGSWSSGQGRINIVDVDPNNANTWYLGTPAGGLWKSTNAGSNWLPMTDFLPQIGVSGIAIDPNNSNIIYIATGDKNHISSYSFGVFKSLDGGQTWQQTGYTEEWGWVSLGDIIIDPNNSNKLFLATRNGLQRSTDGGANWSEIATGDEFSKNFSQGNLRFKTDDSNTVFAVSNNRFYRSTNGGNSFNMITNGLPTNATRMVMDVTADDSSYIYVLCYNSQSDINNGFMGIYRSTDGGTSFQLINNTTNVLESSQGWYDLALCVSPQNKNLIFTGCLNVWKSENGGTDFTKVNEWYDPFSTTYTHADIHYLGYKGNRLFCGSDGGVYSSDNNGLSFTDKTATAQIGQFYKISVSPNTTSKMMGGLQDNGGYGFSNNSWKNWFGADGMATAISPLDDDIFVGFIQYGLNLYASYDGGLSNTGFVGSPNGAYGNWVTPLEVNQNDELFSGFNRLYRLNQNTFTWEAQSTNDFGQNISHISIHPENNQIFYVAVNDILYKSTNGGIDFTFAYQFPNNITSIESHSTDINKVYVTINGWTDNRVFQSSNGGLSFEDISNGLPFISVAVIKHHKNQPDNALYVGTAHGVYYRDDITNSWIPFDTNLPNVDITDLDINLIDNKITAATFGRGIWLSDLPVPLSNSTYNQTAISIYPNPTKDFINIHSPVEQPQTVKLFDISGKLILDQPFDNTSKKINMSQIPVGVYVLKVEFDGTEVMQKVVKD